MFGRNGVKTVERKGEWINVSSMEVFLCSGPRTAPQRHDFRRNRNHTPVAEPATKCVRRLANAHWVEGSIICERIYACQTQIFRDRTPKIQSMRDFNKKLVTNSLDTCILVCDNWALVLIMSGFKDQMNKYELCLIMASGGEYSSDWRTFAIRVGIISHTCWMTHSAKSVPSVNLFALERVQPYAFLDRGWMGKSIGSDKNI